MYKCKPERNPKQALLIIFGCAVILIVISMASVAVKEYNWVYHLLFIIGLTYALFIAYKYTMTEVEYTVDGDTFSVTKTVGRKSVVACSLDLSTAKALVDAAEYKKDKKTFGYIDKKYNFCQNIRGDYWFYICEFNGLTLLIKFEPNEIFAARMKDSIEEIKKD